MEEMHGAGSGKGLPSLQGHLFPHTSKCSPAQAPNLVHFLVFMEASLPSHDCLNHWPLTVDSTSSTSPLPKVRERD